MNAIRKLVVTGAGFSRPIGIPLLGECRAVLRELQEGGRFGAHKEWNFGDETECETQTVTKLLGMWESSDPDVEKFGEQLVNAASTNEGKRNLLRFSAVLIRAFELAMQSDANRIRMFWKTLYLPFARRVAETFDTAFVTFNYDLLIDQALLQQGFFPEYYLGADVNDVNANDKTGIPVVFLRPNGSMNWFICDNPGCRVLTVKWQRKGNDDEDYPGNWGTGPERHTGHLPDPSCESLLRFLIVPPGMKDQERPIQPQLENVHGELRRLLRTAERIFFIGWSAPDTDRCWSKRMLSDCEAEIHVVNKDSSKDLMDRYAQVLPSTCKVRWHTGQERGDVQNFRDSDWGNLLLNC